MSEPQLRTAEAEQQFRTRMRELFRSPMDPDDEQAELDHVDRAVTIAAGVAAAGGQLAGRQSTAPGTPTRWAMVELAEFIRELVQAEHDTTYDAAYDDGYAAGAADREGELRHQLGLDA